MAWRHRKPTYGGDMTGERETQLARREVPYFDDAVPCAGCEPLVARLDGDAAYPTQVPRNDTHELPWRMICRFDGARRFVQRERLREFGRVAERRHPLLGRRIDRSYHPGRLGRRPSGDGFARLLWACWPNRDLLAYEGGGELFVMFVFVVHFHGQT